MMAARKRQCDKQVGIPARRLSWPTVVLAGGVLLSLAANLDQSRPGAARRPSRIADEDGGVSEPSAPERPSPVHEAGDEALLTTARRAAAEHQDQHGQLITRDALRARLGVSNQPPPSCCADSASARACRREPSAPPDPAASPHWQAPWSAEGGSAAGAVCPPGSTALRARRGGRRLDRHREGVATYRDGLVGHGSAGSRPAPTRPVRSGTACCWRRGPPAGCPGRLGRSAELADRLPGFANLSPVHVAS
jgi:hypothetical protein